MKRMLLATTAFTILATGSALAEECRGRLDVLQATISEEPGYNAILAQGIQDEVGILWRTAASLERSGNNDACLQITTAIESLISKTATDYESMGADADSWTQERIARLEAAVPVGEYEGRLRIQDIVGASVYSPADEFLGEIDDVILTSDGIGYAVLGHGGFLEIGEDEIPVPWQHFRVTEDGKTLVLNTDEETLDEAPTLDDIDATKDIDDWTRVDFAEWAEDIEAYFNKVLN